MKKTIVFMLAAFCLRGVGAGVLNLECQDAGKQVQIETHSHTTWLTVKKYDGTGGLMPDLDPRVFTIRMELPAEDCAFTSLGAIQCFHRDCLRLYLFDEKGMQLNYMPPVAEIWFSSMPHSYVAKPQSDIYEFELGMLLHEGRTPISDRIVTAKGMFLTYPSLQCKLPEWKP